MEITDKHQTEIILDSIADGVFTVDSEWKITSFNRAAEKITGLSRDKAIGRHCWDVFRASICESRCSLRQTMEDGESIVNQAIFIVSSEGRRIPVSISTALLEDEKGRFIGGVETFRDLTVLEELKKELKGRHSFFDIISKNPAMQRLFGILENVSDSTATILLRGETGTGKELFARAIHSLSPRKVGPLVTINCGALPDTLLESELFGYKAGAFTDARRDKPGKVSAANGGTLFLDEIGDLSHALQIKLLRFLQEKVYEPLGSNTPEKADVRIVAATNRNLEELVAEGNIRQDLYYRINVVQLTLPPLRERKEDIPLLLEHFLGKFTRLEGKETPEVSSEVLPILMSHDYPGNVRELENIVEYATVVCKDNVLRVQHLPEYLTSIKSVENGSQPDFLIRKNATWEDFEGYFIRECLKKNSWNRASTAAQLGIHPSTLWRRIKRLNIQIPKKDGRNRG